MGGSPKTLLYAALTGSALLAAFQARREAPRWRVIRMGIVWRIVLLQS